MDAELTLLADIGGTNARFALLQGRAAGPVTRFKVEDYPGPVEAIQAYLRQSAPDAPVRRAVLAVAGPVTGDQARLTNGAWSFSGEALGTACGFARVRLVNDFAAVAAALPHLSTGDVAKIGGGQSVPCLPCAVLGPGTGLGVAALIDRDPTPVVLASEGGHATLAAHDDRESAVLGHIRACRQHVAAEDLLSGPGLVKLYGTLADMEGLNAPPRSPEDIVAAALARSCPTSADALDLFCTWLGRFSGDLALVFGARGGLYLAGSLVSALTDYLKASAFRDGFEDKGAFRPYLADIPTFVITRADPAFLGLAGLAAD